MISGLLSGVLWALNSIVLGIVLASTTFVSTEQAILLSTFVATFLNDFFSSMYLFIYNAIRGKLKQVFKVAFSKAGLWTVIASLIGGPIGMTGYVLSIQYMGSSIAAVSSAIYPAIGVICARIFLKQNVKWYQYICLVIASLGIYGMSYSPTIEINNFLIGLIGTVMCSFGWGLEAVLISKSLSSSVDSDIALNIRQTVSWLFYAIVLLPVLQAWQFTIELFTINNLYDIFFMTMLAAFFGTASYLLYYNAIYKIGATKALPLNVTYVAWTIVFSLILFQNVEDYTALSYVCVVIVLISSIFAAIDIKELRRKQND